MFHIAIPTSMILEYNFPFNIIPTAKFEVSALITLNITSTDNA